jgi:hypothetical protein
MKIMLDTMIYDKLVADSGNLQLLLKAIGEGKLALLATHIQRDQLSDIPVLEKRAQVLTIPTTSVPTSGAVFDLSKWDEATWGDAESDQAIECLGIGNPKHAPDALIAATAAGLVDWLVTEDRPLTNRVRRAGLPVEVTDYEGLVALISRI